MSTRVSNIILTKGAFSIVKVSVLNSLHKPKRDFIISVLWLFLSIKLKINYLQLSGILCYNLGKGFSSKGCVGSLWIKGFQQEVKKIVLLNRHRIGTAHHPGLLRCSLSNRIPVSRRQAKHRAVRLSGQKQGKAELPRECIVDSGQHQNALPQRIATQKIF